MQLVGHEAIRSQILLMNPFTSINQAYYILCQAESHLNMLSSQPIYDSPAIAFYSSSSKRNDSIECGQCQFIGHTKDIWYILIGYSHHKLHKKFSQIKFFKNAQKPLGLSANQALQTNSELNMLE